MNAMPEENRESEQDPANMPVMLNNPVCMECKGYAECCESEEFKSSYCDKYNLQKAKYDKQHSPKMTWQERRAERQSMRDDEDVNESANCIINKGSLGDALDVAYQKILLEMPKHLGTQKKNTLENMRMLMEEIVLMEKETGDDK